VTDAASDSASDAGPHLRLQLHLAYDGTEFHGWAAQPGLRTVQGEIEAALARVLRLDRPPRITVAGRTDAGVHARAQVAHVDIPPAAWGHALGWRRGASRPDEAIGLLTRRLNGVLGPDVRLKSIGLAPEGFDARFSAIARRYCYRISDTPASRDPVERGHVLWHIRPLDVSKMHDAAARFLGEHDFAALCRPRPGASTVRRVLEASVHRVGCGGPEADGGRIEIWVEADAFCHSMVRSMAGALVAVGEGRRPVEWIDSVLASSERESAANVLAPHGLTLEAVKYPPPAALAATAQAHRAVRGPLH
jgi:tRNA pseudouridine38-40 synthase